MGKVSYPVYKESLKVNMPPSGLAIIIGAGPNTGTGIARILSHPKHGNLAVALLARRQEGLNSVRSNLQQTSPGSVVETFPTDTSPNNLKQAFKNETYEEFTESLEQYVGGAFTFSQEALKMFFEHHGEAPLSETGEKKGTLIFTGTLGALRCNAEFAAYGAGRSSVRQLAQTLAREMSAKGVHVVHTIANGSIEDKNGEDQRIGKKMSADAVGKTYLW